MTLKRSHTKIANFIKVRTVNTVLAVQLISYSICAQHLSFLTHYTEWDSLKNLPCCISGADWLEKDQKLYFVSDQIDSLYRTSLDLLPSGKTCEIRIGNVERFKIEGLQEKSSLESIRVLHNGTVFLSAERGDKPLESFLYKGKMSMENGTVPVNALNLPDNFQNEFDRNAGIEGITFSHTHQGIWIINERPFVEEPPSGKLLLTLMTFVRQPDTYLYDFDWTKDENGVSEILLYEEDKILAMERSFSKEKKRNQIKIYMVTVGIDRQLKKEKLWDSVDWDSLDRMENYEGMCFGPLSPNKLPTLILISDNNENWNKGKQRTDLLVFEILNK